MQNGELCFWRQSRYFCLCRHRTKVAVSVYAGTGPNPGLSQWPTLKWIFPPDRPPWQVSCVFIIIMFLRLGTRRGAHNAGDVAGGQHGTSVELCMPAWVRIHRRDFWLSVLRRPHLPEVPLLLMYGNGVLVLLSVGCWDFVVLLTVHLCIILVINPSAWSDGHCPHAARSHSFVYISTS